MPRLSRLRFVSIGHTNARFEDLTLDFRDAAGSGTDSTLWLRNAGGKTSILNLFFAGIRPSRREFLGKRADAKRELREYVQTEDRAVVVYEWELDGKPGLLEFDGHVDRFITGALYEWRSGELKPVFFACRVSANEPQLTLDGLPLYREENGERVGRRTAMGFKQEWQALQKQHPNCHVVATETQSEWRAILDGAGIDPELFRYQIVMNHREGGADDLFRFDSHDDFVDFLLELVLDGSLGETVRKNLDRHREDLRRRKHRLLPERELVQGLCSRLGPLTEIAAEREQLARSATEVTAQMEGLRRFVSRRGEEHNTEAKKQAEVQEMELGKAMEAEQKLQGLRRFAAAGRLFAAEYRHKYVQDEYQRIQQRLEVADIQRKIWEAAIPLRNARRYERRARDYRAELTHKRSEHQPLCDELRETGSQYAQAMGLKIDSLREAEGKMQRLEREARSRATAHRAEVSQFEAKAATSRAEIVRLEGLLGEGLSERTCLGELRILCREERGDAALVRLIERLANNGAKLSRIESTIHEQRDRKERLAEVRQSAALTAAQAAERERESQKKLEDAFSLRRKLESDQLLRQTLEVEELDLEQVTETSLELLHQHSTLTLDRIISLRIARVEDERAVHHLETRGLLPPSRDVERLLELLTPRVRAWSGWVYICDSVKEGRAAIEQSPELALGVIVSDSDFEVARSIVLGSSMTFDSPIVLAPQSAFDTERPARGIVLGPHSAAYFDRSAGQQEQARRQAQLDQYSDDLNDFDVKRRHLTDLESQLNSFRTAYPRGWFAEQERTIAQHRQSRDVAEGRVQQLTEEIATTGREISDLEAEAQSTRNEIGKLEAQRRRVEDFVERFEKLTEERDEAVRAARALVAAAEQSIRQLKDEASIADQEATRLAKQAKERIGEISRLELLLEQVEYRSAELHATSETAEELRDKYRRLKSQYEENVGAEGWLQLARENDENASRERGQLSKMLTEELVEEKVKAVLSTLGDPEQAEDARQVANDTYTSAFSASGNAKQALERSERRVKDMQRAFEEVGTLESWAADEAPEDDEAAERLAEESDLEADVLQEQMTKHFDAAGAAEAAQKSAAKSAELMDSCRENLEVLSGSYSELLAGACSQTGNGEQRGAEISEEQVRIEIQHVRDALERLKQEWRRLNERRATAALGIRHWAGNERFETLPSQVARQFRAIDEASLEERAAYFAEELELRAKTIGEKLAEIDQNREQLVSELEALAEDGLSVLRSAANQSRLPDSVPELGGVQFLTISMKTPEDPAEHRGRLGELVDEFVDEESTPTGMELIQRAVRRLARPVRARVLNPDPNLKGQRLDIPDLAKFSGGERLTCAVLLYCTLAQLRARKRGLFRKPTGVLLLDNPIGSASRVTFLNLQRDVARAMGIQLIYTTGVNDYEALRQLPNLIRLRNDRANRHTGEHIVEHENGSVGIEAARVVRNESDSTDGDGLSRGAARDAYV